MNVNLPTTHRCILATCLMLPNHYSAFAQETPQPPTAHADVSLSANDADAIASANRGLALTYQVASRLNQPFYWAPFIIVGSGL